MNTYIIAYDLSKPGQNYNDLIKTIEAYKTWSKMQQSVWIIVTKETAEQVRDKLTRYIDANDKLFVGGLTGEGAWIGYNQSKTEWLNKYL